VAKDKNFVDQIQDMKMLREMEGRSLIHDEIMTDKYEVPQIYMVDLKNKNWKCNYKEVKRMLRFQKLLEHLRFTH
jgi:hypothetical protein